MARAMPRTRSGFTLIDAAGLILACAVLAAALLAMSCQSGASGRAGATTADARSTSRQLKCATQIRGITQGMIVWAQSNRDQYPLPSNLDKANDTVGEIGRAKNTSANIMSMMIFVGMISSDICICPNEHDRKIDVFPTYEFASPKSAKRPAMALWDPAFGADFTSGKGNLSYAHLQPSGDFEAMGEMQKDGKTNIRGTGRLTMWCDTFALTEAVLADRAPEIESVTFSNPKNAATAAVKTKRADSITLKNHGPPNSWEGNVVYNDNHVTFESTLGPPVPPALAHTYTDKSGATHFDTYHFDEPDDANQSNTFLGIFVKAGKMPSEFKAIWD